MQVEIASASPPEELLRRLTSTLSGLGILWPVLPLFVWNRRLIGRVGRSDVKAAMAGWWDGVRIFGGSEIFEGRVEASGSGSVLLGEVRWPTERIVVLGAVAGGVFALVLAGGAVALGAIGWLVVAIATVIGAVLGVLSSAVSGDFRDMLQGPTADANVEDLAARLRSLVEGDEPESPLAREPIDWSSQD